MAKRHHWWPTCHSKLWVDGEGCVTAISGEGKVRRTQPINTAVIGHHNSVRRPDETRDPALERFFANEIEGPVGPVLARLATERRRDHVMERSFDRDLLRREGKGIREDGFVPDERAFSAGFTDADRRALARYIASLIVRVPSYKDELNSNRMLQNVGALLGCDEANARFETDMLHVELVRQHLEEYAARLQECAFVLFDGSGQEFVFGDTPVIPAALGFGEAEAMCPISPDRALLIVRGDRPPVRDRIAIMRALPRSVRAFNRTVVQNAEREVFCRRQVPVGFVTSHLGMRQVRFAPNIETAAGEHSTRGPMLDRQSGSAER